MKLAFARLTLASLVLAVLMSVLSAYIRLADSGIDCEPWPECHLYSFRIDSQPGITIGAEESHQGLRTAHRFMASLFGVAAILMVILSWWSRDQISTRLLPLLVFILTLVLTFVGMRTPDLPHPAVMLTNLLGGMLLSALLLWQYLRCLGPGCFSLPALAVWLLLVTALASGAWVNANFAAGACPDLFNCSASLRAEAFDPARVLDIRDGHIIADGAQPLIYAVHGMLSVMLVVAVLAYTTWVYQREMRLPVLPLGLVVGLAGLALLEPLFRSTASAAAHNLLSLLLLLSVTRECYRGSDNG